MTPTITDTYTDTTTPTLTPTATMTTTPIADGSIGVSNTPILHSSTQQAFTFTYTAGPTTWVNGGTLTIDIPALWPDAQTTDPNATAGYTSVTFSVPDSGSVSVINAGRTILVTANSLTANTGTITVIYGAQPNFAVTGVDVPAATGTYTFTTQSDPLLDGPGPLAIQPQIVVN
jgi:hypothetical protein